MDFNCTYLSGKKVAIIDDIVISGTSISSTVNKLLQLDITEEDIEIITIALDLKYFAMKFDRPEGKNALLCEKEFSDEICIDLSGTVSKIFSYYGVPYDVDFPTYESIPIEPRELNLFHDNILWDVMDVTNSNQEAGQVSSYSLYPKRCVRDKLWNVLGIELEKTAHLKIRTYIKRHPNGSLSCPVVPMCLFNEISEQNLNELYNFLIPENGSITLNRKNIPVAQMRYLQFYIAHQLYVVFSEIMSLGEKTAPHEDILRQLFGYVDGETIKNSINAPHCRKADADPPHIADVESDGQRLAKKYLNHPIGRKSLAEAREIGREAGAENGCWVNQAIFAPFLWWYQTKEIPVRNILHRKGLHYIRDYETIESVLVRLNSGFTLATLKSILKVSLEELPEAESEIVISSLIDRAIDEGIIVPTIYYNKDKKYLCRAYRHGEDLPFGPADKCRLLYFLKYLGEEIPSLLVDKNGVAVSGIAEISMEKMIVLFYQMGLKRGGIFNRFLGLGNMKILRPFLSLHGKVIGSVDSNVETHMYSERNSNEEEYITWLTVWLANKENQFIKWVYDPEDKQKDRQKKLYSIDPDKIQKYLRRNERSSITEPIKRNIKSIAGMVAAWYEEKAKREGKNAFKNDITALTSCVDGHVFCAAIGTELHYFSKFWKKQAKAAFTYAENSEQLIDWLSKPSDEEEKALKYILAIEQGLNSGRDKVEWFAGRSAVRIITEVEGILRNKISNETADVWAGFWDYAKANLIAPDRGMNEKHKALAAWAVGNLFLFSACFDCLKSADFWNSTGKPVNYEAYKAKYGACSKQTCWLEQELFRQLDEVTCIPKNQFGTKAEKFNRLVNRALTSLKRFIPMIEELLKDEIPNFTVEYKSALILDIHPFGQVETNSKLTELWSSYDEDISKTELNIVQFPSNFCTPPFVRYGIFYGTNNGFRPPDSNKNIDAQGKKTSEDMLLDVFERLCDLFQYNAYTIRGIMLPHLEPAQSFTHNLQKSIPEHVEEFYDLVVSPLEPYYIENKKRQLILGIDSNTTPQFMERFEGWTDRETHTRIQDADWLDECTVFSDDYLSLSDNELVHRIIYSFVTIRYRDENVYGLGFLLRTQDRVVCISCNHVVRKYLTEGKEIIATSVHDTNISFPLTPIKNIVEFNYDKGTIAPAEDETAVLHPCWDRHDRFDFSMLLCEDDFISNVKERVNQCCIFVGGVNAESFCWRYNLKLTRVIPKGYCQISGADNKLKAGFSGGIYITDEVHPLILGIHEGRNKGDDMARMIPWEAIKKAIEGIK